MQSIEKSIISATNKRFDFITVWRFDHDYLNKKYGQRLGSASEMARTVQKEAKPYTVNFYGKQREAKAYDRVVMLKMLKRPVRVVWVFRRTQWIALFSTDLDLSVAQIIEYYGARWQIESGFK